LVDLRGFEEDLDRFIEGKYRDVSRGLVVSVAVGGRVVYRKAFGSIPELGFEYRVDTIFDLASLTKPLVTALLYAKLLERGELSLEDTLDTVSKRFKGMRIGGLTLRSLLTHSSGLPPHIQLYRFGRDRETYVKVIEASYRESRAVEEVYSDLNYILLGISLEDFFNEPLDSLARREIFTPLGMNDTFFNPPQDLKHRIAPTEVTEDRGLVWGSVHDENAYYLGGVAGHAGLFSTVLDLEKYLDAYTSGRLVRKPTVELMTTPINRGIGGVFGLGWMVKIPRPRRPSPSYGYTAFMGDYASYGSYGHTGFTGTSILVDPEKSCWIILLTNRVYPTRANENIKRFRRLLHNFVLSRLSE